MKKILVPTDFSNAAKNAAEYAVHFAKKIKASILLFHVYNLPIAPSPDGLILIPTADELQEDNEKRLKKEVARLKQKTTIEIGYKATLGLAADEIKQEENKADFIVMGITGTGKTSELIFGSVTTAILKKVSKPVIVIPEKSYYKNPERIVLASDFAPFKNVKILDKLNSIIAQFKSTVYIVNVQEKKVGLPVENTIAEAQLETRLKDAEHFYYYPEHEDAVEGINEFVKTKKADMLAVVPHHYAFVERLFHKSFSKKMAFHTQVPLLVLPDHKA